MIWLIAPAVGFLLYVIAYNRGFNDGWDEAFDFYTKYEEDDHEV